MHFKTMIRRGKHTQAHATTTEHRHKTPTTTHTSTRNDNGAKKLTKIAAYSQLLLDTNWQKLTLVGRTYNQQNKTKHLATLVGRNLTKTRNSCWPLQTTQRHKTPTTTHTSTQQEQRHNQTFKRPRCQQHQQQQQTPTPTTRFSGISLNNAKAKERHWGSRAGAPKNYCSSLFGTTKEIGQWFWKPFCFDITPLQRRGRNRRGAGF